MPRSFLVKKQQSSRRVCRGRQSRQTDEPSWGEHEDLVQQSGDPHRHQELGGSWKPPHSTPQLSSALCPLSLGASPVLQLRCPDSSTFSLSDSHSDVDPRSPLEALGPSQTCTTLILELQCEAEEPQQAKDRLPARLALVPGVPAGGVGGQGSLDCSDCRQRFFSEISRREHLRCQWSSEKFFSCKYCDKEYVSLGALKMHVRTHTLPYVCKLCGKAFSRPWLLQGHIRTHTGEKPFTCLHCGRAFADRSNLRAHLQTHADVKKYQCGSCCKTFSRISLLAKHQEAGCPLC